MRVRTFLVALVLLAAPAIAGASEVETCVAEAAAQGRTPAPAAFDDMISTLERCALLAPKDPALPIRLAGTLWRKVEGDRALSADQKRAYLERGVGHASTALRLAEDDLEATVLKGLLLLSQAALTTDVAQGKALRDEAAALKARAAALKASGGQPRPDPYAALFAPPPSSPAAPGPQRVGGSIKEPKKIKHVNPNYPESVRNAGIDGTVVLEAVIGTDGKVKNLDVVRRVHPDLDRLAVAAVRQWEYTPTTVDGVAVPVIMTITVNFRRY